MASYLLIFWFISLPAIILQLGIKISCNGQTTTASAISPITLTPTDPVPSAISPIILTLTDPIPSARPDDTHLTIPGCGILDSYDCLVARAAFRIPEYCTTYATTVNCVLHLHLAFCGDIHLPAVHTDTGPLQNCINAIPFGPCHYNTTGRACTSGLFSNFKFVNNSDPPRISLPLSGGPGPEFELQLDIPEVIFGGVLDYSWDPSIWTTDLKHSDDDVKNALYNIGQFMVGTLY